MILASQGYKVRLCRMEAQEVADLYEDSTLVEFYSIAGSSIAAGRIPILFLGGCSARCQLHAGIGYVPTRSILIE